MDYSTGKVLFIFMLAVLLSWVGAWLVARSYRNAMRRLMSAPLVQPSPAGGANREDTHATPQAAAAPVTAPENRRAGNRLAMLLIALSALISLTSAALQLHVVMDGMAFSLRRLALIGFVEMWPVIPVLGLLWRWSGWRVLGALALWFVVCFLVALSQSVEPRPLEVLAYLGFEIGPAMLLVAAVCLGGTTRAVAPWLLIPMIGLVWASQTGLDLIAVIIKDPPEWFHALTGVYGAFSTMALFALAPWLVAWWPLKWLGKLLAQAYTRKALSELMVLFTAVWGIAQLVQALSAASHLGLGGIVMLLPLAWIPVVMAIIGLRRRTLPGRPPTLLVLRVFQHDRRIQELFDHVIERWRLTGNTVLIAGTDLVERTLDADDLFTFIDGRLATRFIRSPADVAPRLGEFDLAPDLEGRYRVNECYCHDTTWQQALDALVMRSDVVLMDLRSFKAYNEGCRHELGVLSRALRIARVVVLTDGDTDRAAALAAVAGAPPERFVWLDTSHIDRAKRRAVLEILFVGPSPRVAS
jgi:hypothetical protein